MNKVIYYFFMKPCDKQSIIYCTWLDSILTALVAQLGERMTEDHKVRGSIPREGIFFMIFKSYNSNLFKNTFLFN